MQSIFHSKILFALCFQYNYPSPNELRIPPYQDQPINPVLPTLNPYPPDLRMSWTSLLALFLPNYGELLCRCEAVRTKERPTLRSASSVERLSFSLLSLEHEFRG